MSNQNYRIASEWGLIGTRKGSNGQTAEIRLTKTAWFGKPPKWDLRLWEGEIAKGGVSMTDEQFLKLRDLMNSIEIEEEF